MVVLFHIRHFLLVIVLILPCWCAVAQGTEHAVNSTIMARAAEVDLGWKPIDKGLDVCQLVLSEETDSAFVLLRIDPSLYSFSLHMASEEGGAYPLNEWLKRQKLVAAINASMFLPDNRTSIGLMQNQTHINNERISKVLGAFFVAEPVDDKSGLPNAAIMERNEGWKEAVAEYTIVVQNFRMLDSNGEILWKRDTKSYSIAALADDADGNIYFILSQYPMTGAEFASFILSSGIGVRSLLYVEGGEKAALCAYWGNEPILWVGRKNLFFNVPGNPAVQVPNIIGVQRR